MVRKANRNGKTSDDAHYTYNKYYLNLGHVRRIICPLIIGPTLHIVNTHKVCKRHGLAAPEIVLELSLKLKDIPDL